MWYRNFLIALALPMAASAAEPGLTLDQAIDLALRGAPQVAASAATLEAAEAVAPSAGRLPDPELVTGVQNVPITGEDRFSLTSDFMTMSEVGVMQSFPSGEKRRLQRERAAREVDVARGTLRKTRFEIAQEVGDLWIAGAVAQESLARLRNLRPETELQAVAARAALASGRTAAVDALSMQALDARLADRILALQQDLEMKRAELTRWIGSAADQSFDAIPTDRELGLSAEHLTAGVPDHPPLAPLIAQLAVAQSEVDLARAEKRPDWSAELMYGRRGPDFSDMVSLEFRVGLPIFSRHRQDPVIAEKLANLRAREAERDAEVRMHTAEIQASAAEWRRSRERLQHYSAELLPLARDRSRAALASYGSARGDLRGVIDALTDEIDVQIDEIQLQGAVARTWVFLHLLHDSGSQP
jgi:outer membrane protein, heavy metal efflux system